MTSLAEVNEAQSEVPPLPECLTLWFCIGCGAMGNAEPCSGSCNFRKIDIVSAAKYADLLETLEQLGDEVERSRVLVHEVASLTTDPRDWESACKSLGGRARAVLSASHAAAATPPDAADIAAERMTIWRCATCGQVEAPQECLGICIRRNGEFVGAEDHDHIVEKVAVAREKARGLGALLRQLAWVSPRDGQWERTCRAFQTQAAKLIGSISALPM